MNLAFIVIDDSELDCFIAKKVIEHNDESTKVTIYKEATLALQAIRSTLATANLFTIILLDLRMPVMNGFQFIEEFEKLPPYVQQQYAIYILSSTKNEIDINRALGYQTVVSALEKPLTKISLGALLYDVRHRHF
ncbi:response regulator [Mucilaginibacter sp. Bleaf8]|uniref:response regulator n=1 Tax=Mucilaginibacter sp. Bleaf8 TaxID=2834430 RepID=UPI001BCB847E|nr:response regulator [Mucilaginibacter sp. Bleaf8]MBS7567007.1 response regulator [Mucilaginibacter sp. Bleaf8]